MEETVVGSTSNTADSLKATLQKLLRTTIKCFYLPEDLLMVDLLIRETDVTEKRIESVLKFDIKFVRACLATLRANRFISKTTRKEPRNDGRKWQVVDYYHIKYENLVDVIRYKLDHVQKRVETLERQSMGKESFICKPCEKTWTDLDAGELFNLSTLRFCCTLCEKPIVGESSETSSRIRLLMARFNEEVSPIYDLLKKCDDCVTTRAN